MSHLDRGDEVRADLAELRHETQLGFARLDARLATIDQRFATFDQKFITIDQKFVTFDQKLDGVRLEIREQTAVATARLLKWSFVFWVSAVGAIAGLAGVLK